jgi:CubicO group peptidase (beta-lactamase class C family)
MKRLALAALAVPSMLAAQTRDIGPMVDSIFQRWSSTRSPGCAVGVAQHGRVLLTRGYGMANLETGTPITAETIFESGSVAKQFTATAVWLLAMDGRLRLDEPVRRYLPEFPEYDRPITVRHLLTHTSGLRDWGNLVAAGGWPRGERVHNQTDLLDVVYRQKALNYPVGDYYSYTNSGYAVAVALIERVSGKSFDQFTQERIFRPLGMTHTSWRTDYTALVPGRAQAYERQGGEWRLDTPHENVVGPGGMLTTVGDWMIWNEALSKNTLRAGHADSLTRRMRLTSGRQIPYALGIVVGQYRGVPEIGHSGSTGGYSTYLARYPDQGNLSIAVLCNAAAPGPGGLMRQIADRMITDFPERPVTQAGRPDSAAFARFHGIYRDVRTSAAFEVGAEVGRTARPTSDAAFLMGANRWRFEVDAAGRPRLLTITTPDGDNLLYTFMSAAAWTPTAAQLRAFEGSYRSEEIGATYAVRVAGDSLTYSRRPGTSITVRPTHQDAFARGGGAVWFTRDRDGRVAAMHVSDGRMWNLVLARVP